MKGTKKITNQKSALEAEKRENKALVKRDKALKKARKQTMRKAAREDRMSLMPIKQNLARNNTKLLIREAKAYDAVDGKYIKCVFDPLNNPPSRLPSIFPTPSALFKYTNIVDITVPASTGGLRSYVCVQPWNLFQTSSGGVTTPGYISIGMGKAAFPTQEFDSSVGHQMQGFIGQDSSTARFTAFRCVANQIVIECTAPVLNIQGTVTGAMVPGLGLLDSQYLPGWMPTPTQLVQHPFGFQREVKDLTADWPFQVNYFPLDPLDSIYHTADEPSDNIRHRNSMYVQFENFSAPTTFRCRVTSVIEYLPVLSFRQWTDTTFPDDKPRTFDVLRSVVAQNPKHTVAGALDSHLSALPNEVSGDGFLSFVKKAVGAVGSVADEMGGLPRLIGAAIRGVGSVL